MKVQEVFEVVMDKRDQLVQELFNARKEKAHWEKVVDQVEAELKPLVDPEFDMHADLGLPISSSVIHCGALDLTRVPCTSSRLSVDALLASGISQKTIDFATLKKPYYQYKITKAKGAG